ncbi:MAG: hypothetical protein CMF12_06870 [Idiomarina sp.]|uniref:galactosyltransferase-related protein n=1 Tax=Idiomarina sp. TaxID=1874361 RepID=UPI000C64FE7E|nr:galactosyltransferase-related protein [Idiomarina sp.]MBT42232.1 hypothetical protein [Idiomarina sp.]
MEFWKHINRARSLVKSGESELASETLKNIPLTEFAESRINIGEKIDFLKKFIATYDIALDTEAFEIQAQETSRSSEKKILPKVNDDVGKSIDNYVEQVGEGVSLVTCCKNRNENLVKAIPSWISCDDIDEIVIVDWSSDEPVKDYLQEKGIEDARIKVVRVDDQPRWILSYAFNIGFRIASYDKVLKTDADIVLSSDFFRKNKLTNDVFIAGDWRKAAKGQEFINGFFYVPRVNLQRINGFNEYITTYGWDDDDIYDRLTKSGLTRKLVDTSTIYHLPHDDTQRTGEDTEDENHLNAFFKTTKAKIRANRFIANVMPTWDRNKICLPFSIQRAHPGCLHLTSAGETIHYVPTHIQEDASYYSAVEQLAWQVGLRAFDLDREQLFKLLKSKPFKEQNILDIEVALHNKAANYLFNRHYLVIDIEPNLAQINEPKITELLEKLLKIIELKDLGIVIASDSRPQVANILAISNKLGFVPRWRNLGQLKSLRSDSITLTDLGEQSHRFSLKDQDDLEALIQGVENVSLGESIATKPKFYVDAQHGLGNRLRAIGSAAAIAKATGRELVIVWEPDHHCECRFSDLFDYNGEVLEKSFIEEAKSSGMSVYNYMEIEEGSKKDELIPKEISGDIYGRSAYVFQSEYSNWDEENKFIRSLKPSKQVQELIDNYNLEGCVGVHVRMEAGKGLDHNTYDDVSNWTEKGHEQIHYWREKSHYSHFIKRIEQLMQEDPGLEFFLAADLPETYKIFMEYFGNKCHFLPRDVFDRSRDQIIYAVADAILLSKCNYILGSNWSSFSELALRLAEKIHNVEISGVDF